LGLDILWCLEIEIWGFIEWTLISIFSLMGEEGEWPLSSPKTRHRPKTTRDFISSPSLGLNPAELAAAAVASANR